MRSLYDIFNCDQNASADDLKRAYHQAARKFHPDKNIFISNDDSSSFIELTKAWNILGNVESRCRYDRWLREQILREESGIVYDIFTFDDVLKKWTLIQERTEEEDAGTFLDSGNARKYYSYDCRCGGYYVYDETDVEEYVHQSIYILCSNCSLIVKIDFCNQEQGK